MIFHLAELADWRDAQRSGAYTASTRGATIDEVGFLHGSANPDQLARVAEALYPDVTEPLVLLSIDEDDLAAHGLTVRVEPGESSDPDSELFPHIYGGPLPVAAIRAAAAWRPKLRPFTGEFLEAVHHPDGTKIGGLIRIVTPDRLRSHMVFRLESDVFESVSDISFAGGDPRRWTSSTFTGPEGTTILRPTSADPPGHLPSYATCLLIREMVVLDLGLTIFTSRPDGGSAPATRTELWAGGDVVVEVRDGRAGNRHIVYPDGTPRASDWQGVTTRRARSWQTLIAGLEPSVRTRLVTT